MAKALHDMAMSEYVAHLEDEQDRVRAEIEVLKCELAQLKINKRWAQKYDKTFVIDGNAGMKNLEDAMRKILIVDSV